MDDIEKPQAVGGGEVATKKRLLIASGSKCSYCTLKGEVILPAEMDVNSGAPGFVFRFVNENNYGYIGIARRSTFVFIGGKLHETKYGETIVGKVVGGVKTIIGADGGPEGAKELTGGPVYLTVDTFGNISFNYNGVVGPFNTTFNDEDFEKGNVLGEGKVGIHDEYAETPTIAAKRKYLLGEVNGVVAGEEELQNAICYAGRQLEIRSDGVFRQHPTLDAWARLIPDGFLPYAKPSGLEERATMMKLLPSVGNFRTHADAAKVSLKAQGFYFPAYHFTSEAAKNG